MRVWPVVLGCALIAAGLFAWLGSSLTGGLSGASEGMLLDAFFGLPGVLMGGGAALFLFGFTDSDARKQ